jgi:hypothetical protein
MMVDLPPNILQSVGWQGRARTATQQYGLRYPRPRCIRLREREDCMRKIVSVLALLTFAAFSVVASSAQNHRGHSNQVASGLRL